MRLKKIIKKGKKQCVFFIDPKIYKAFMLCCKIREDLPQDVLEEFMISFVESDQTRAKLFALQNRDFLK